MKRILTTLALVAAGSAAMADGATYDYPTPVTSSVSRAEVRADAVQALRSGETAIGEVTQVAQVVSSTRGTVLTRTQVAAEAAEAVRLNLVARGEVLPVATPAQLQAVMLAGQRAVNGPVMASAR